MFQGEDHPISTPDVPERTDWAVAPAAEGVTAA